MSLKRKIILSLLLSSVFTQSATSGITEAWSKPGFFWPILITAGLAQVGTIISIGTSHEANEQVDELRDMTAPNSCGNDLQCFADRAVIRDRTEHYDKGTNAIYAANGLGLGLAGLAVASGVFIPTEKHRAIVVSSLLIGSLFAELISFGYSYRQNIDLVSADSTVTLTNRGDIRDQLSDAIKWARGSFYPLIPSIVALAFHGVYTLVAFEAKYFAKPVAAPVATTVAQPASVEFVESRL